MLGGVGHKNDREYLISTAIERFISFALGMAAIAAVAVAAVALLLILTPP